MRRASALLIAGAAVLCGSCYHITVITGAPASATVIEEPWQPSFIAALIAPPVINTKDRCPQSVARVETERTFLNALVSSLTSEIFTPMAVTITCASGPVRR